MILASADWPCSPELWQPYTSTEWISEAVSPALVTSTFTAEWAVSPPGALETFLHSIFFLVRASALYRYFVPLILLEG